MPNFVKPEVKVDNTLAAQAFAAIGSVSRIQVLGVILEAGESGLTIGEIQKKTGIAASTLAHHLRFLCDASLVIQEKQGRRILNRTHKQLIEALGIFLTNISNSMEEGE